MQDEALAVCYFMKGTDKCSELEEKKFHNISDTQERLSSCEDP